MIRFVDVVPDEKKKAAAPGERAKSIAAEPQATNAKPAKRTRAPAKSKAAKA